MHKSSSSHGCSTGELLTHGDPAELGRRKEWERSLLFSSLLFLIACIGPHFHNMKKNNNSVLLL